MKKLILLDAYALIYRAFYALMRSPRINSKGFNTSTIMGFVNTLNDILEKEHPTHIAIAFDPHGPTFRHEAYPAYKAQRDKTPEGIQESVPIIKDIIKAYGITIFEESGYEADDVIGTLATQAAEKGFETYMVTPDKDYCQLVTDHIHIIHPSHGKNNAEILGPADVIEKYGLTRPSQVIDMLGLMGDAVDNVPGCPGVGQKTAVNLIQQFGSIEGIYQHLDDIKGKLKEKIAESKEQVLFSKFLVTIKTDVPLIWDEDKLLQKKRNDLELKRIFSELEFRTLMKKMLGETVTEKREKNEAVQLDLFASVVSSPQENEKEEILRGDISPADSFKSIEEEKDIADFIQKICAEKSVGFSLATTSSSALDAEIIGIGFSSAHEGCCYLSFTGNEEERSRKLESCRVFFENKSSLKICFDMKSILLNLSRYKIPLWGQCFDIQLAHYVIQPEQRHSLPYLAENYLHFSPINIEDAFTTAKEKNLWNMEQVSAARRASYTAQRADICRLLKDILESELKANNGLSLFEDIEMPLVPVLAEMECNGVRVDIPTLKEISTQLNERMKGYEATIYQMAGQPFTISSPRQVGEILFDVMQLDSKAKRTKSGQYETSESVLTALKGKHPIVENILSYRGLKKLLTTYVDALPHLVNPHTGHIHTTFHQALTATGRLSCSNPNLQNIPVRGEDGKEIRKAFIPDEGCEFFSADYSQIELRILAHLSQDQQMIHAFQDGYDIHAATAAKIYHKPLDSVTADERRKAKTANFGIVYGITTFGLSERIGVSRSEAKELIDNYFLTFPHIKEYIEKVTDTARQQGYVETIFHRRRYLPDINSRNAVVRNFAERNAVNAPIQGSAADIIKLAMIRIARRFKEEGLRSQMILQVHDELNFSVYPEEKDKVESIVTYEMAQACRLDVPLVADCGWGNNWLEAH